jgi:hypothetical protein
MEQHMTDKIMTINQALIDRIAEVMLDEGPDVPELVEVIDHKSAVEAKSQLDSYMRKYEARRKEVRKAVVELEYDKIREKHGFEQVPDATGWRLKE